MIKSLRKYVGDLRSRDKNINYIESIDSIPALKSSPDFQSLQSEKYLNLNAKESKTDIQSKRSKKDFTRTIVYVRRNRSFPFEVADFSTCLFDYFDLENEEPGFLECFLEQNKVFMQLPEITRRRSQLDSPKQKQIWRKVYRLEHPVFCAVHRLSDASRVSLPPEIAARGMDVGVSVLLESSDGKILVTRRAFHMRSFPGIWVPPGGHIEDGETFEQAGLREVYEETGIELPNDIPCRVLGLWESVFPSVLYEGDPKRHHLVVYMLAAIKQSSKELQTQVKLDPVETDACMWISEELLAIVVHGGVPGYQVDRLHIPITTVNSDGSHNEDLLDPKALRKKMPAPDRIVERFSTGTRFAFKLWLSERRGESEEVYNENLSPLSIYNR